MAFLKRASKKEKEIKTPDSTSSEGKIGAVREQKEMIGILLRPHITEKTAMQGGNRAGIATAARNHTYAFAVADNANKSQIKKAVEARYHVSVTHVRVLNTDGKQVRRGRQIGWRNNTKKAYATIAEGQTIEIQ